MRLVIRYVVGVASALCLAAQTAPPKSANPDQQPQPSSQSLPPGPVGLQPLLNSGKGGKEAKPPADAADPGKMAAPAETGGAAKTGSAAAVNAKTYLIGPEDVLRVLVWNQPNLSGEFAVRPDGRISMLLIGDVQAGDKSPEQLGAEITQKLKDGKILLEPNVIVQVAAVHSKKYYIEGEVNRPGSYDLVVPTTIMEGLVNAGGFRDFANLKKIVVLRDGGRQVLKFNYNEVSKGKHIEQNILLQPGDHIIIR